MRGKLHTPIMLIGVEYHGSMNRYFDAEQSAGAYKVLLRSIVRVGLGDIECNSKMDSHLSDELSKGAYIVVSQGQDELNAIGTRLADYIVQSVTA